MMNRPFASDVQFGLQLAIFLVVGLVIGGAGTISGAVPGALVYVFVPYFMSEWTDDQSGMPPGLKQVTAAVVRLARAPPGRWRDRRGVLRHRAARARVHPARWVHRRDAPAARPSRCTVIPNPSGCGRNREHGVKPIGPVVQPTRTTARASGDFERFTRQLIHVATGGHNRGEQRRRTDGAPPWPCGLAGHRARRLRSDDDDIHAAAPTGAATDIRPGGATDDRGGSTDTTPVARRRRRPHRSSPRGEHAGSGDIDRGEQEPAAAGVGLIDGVYKGTGGFELDPADCPEDWDPKQGITDTEIKLFRACRRPVRSPGSASSPTAPRATSSTSTTTVASTAARSSSTSRTTATQPDKTKTNVDEALGSGKYAALTAIARHAEQPGHLGRDQRRVHAAAAQRHRRRRTGVTSRTTRGPRACSSTTSPRPACGPSGCRRSTPT